MSADAPTPEGTVAGGAPEPPQTGEQAALPGGWRKALRIVRRVLRWLRRLVLGLLLVAVGLVGWIVGTESGLRFAVTRGLAFYNDLIPGHLSLDAVEGTLLDQFALRGLEGRDAKGTPRVRLDRLGLDWTPGALLDAELPVQTLRLEGLWLLLGPGADAAPLLDLAPPPSDAPPPPPAPPSGPLRLPVEVFAGLELRDIKVEVEGATAPLVELPILSLWARVHTPALEPGEPPAHAVITAGLRRLQVALPQNDLEIEQLGLAARFDGAEAALTGLQLDTNLATLRTEDVRFDLATQRGVVALRIRGLADALNARLGAQLPSPLTADPLVTLTAGGGVEGFDLRLDVDAGEGARIELEVAGALQPAPTLDLNLRLLELSPNRLLPEAQAKSLDKARVAGTVTARITGPPTPLDALAKIDPKALTANVQVRCPACAFPPVGKFSADLDARLEGGVGHARIAAQALGARVDAEASVSAPLNIDEADLEARWSVRVADVAKAAKLGGQEASGALRTQGGCAGRLDALVCRGTVHGDDLALPAQQVAVRALDVRYEVVPLVAPLRFDARVKVAGVAAPGTKHLVGATVTAVGSPDDVRLTLLADHGPDLVDTALRVRPKPALRVNLARLKARAEGIGVALVGPAQVDLSAQGKVTVDHLRLDVLGGRVGVSGAFDAKGRSDLKVALTHLDLARLGRFVPDLAGTLGLDLQFKGAMAAPNIDVDLDLAGAGFKGQVLGDVTLKVAAGGGQAAVDLALKGSGERSIVVAVKAPLRLNLESGNIGPIFNKNHDLKVTWSAVEPAWFGPLAPLPKGVDFHLTGALEAHGNADDWRTSLAVKGDVSAPKLAPAPLELSVEATPSKQQLGLQVTVTPPLPEGAVDGSGAPMTPPPPVPITVAAEAGLDLKAFLPPPFGTARKGATPVLDLATPVKAVVSMPPVLLDAFGGFLPPGLDDPKGTLLLDAAADGTIGEPNVSGGLKLTDGQLTVVAIGQRLKKLNLEVGLEGKEVVLKKLTFKAGEGKGKATGRVGLAEAGIDAQVDFKLTDFPVLAPGAPPLKVGTRLQVSASVPKKGMRRIGLKVTGTEVELVDLSAKGPRPIPTSDAVVYVDDAAREAAAAKAEAEAAGNAALAAAKAQPVLTELLVDVQDPILLRGAVLDMAWGGRIRVVAGGPKSVVEGALVAKRGFFELLSHRFVMDEGEVTLAQGSAGEPFIRLAATTRTEYGDVTATIRGRASRPELIFTSNPPMAEEQILSLLVTGTPTPGEGEQSNVQEQAANMLAGFSSPRLERALQDSLGIDRVKLTFGEGGLGAPILSFGKHVTRWLYVEGRYRYNALPEENETEVNAEAEVIPRWTVESRYGDRAVGGLDVFWRVPISPPAYARVNAGEEQAEPVPSGNTAPADDDTTPAGSKVPDQPAAPTDLSTPPPAPASDQVDPRALPPDAPRAAPDDPAERSPPADARPEPARPTDADDPATNAPGADARPHLTPLGDAPRAGATALAPQIPLLD